MSIAKQNKHIGRLIVGAMSIDGTLDSEERLKVTETLKMLGMEQLLSDVGNAIEDDDGTFNLFNECKELLNSLGADAPEVTPLVFRIVCEVVAYDRFVSGQEAAYLSALGKRLELSPAMAKSILKQVIAERGSRLEVSGNQIDPSLHPGLKELLSFSGSDQLVGKLSEDSIETLISDAKSAFDEVNNLSVDDLSRALAILGLKTNAKFQDATEVWQEALENINLGKLSKMGETFVSAALQRIIQLNEAYKVISTFNKKKS